MRSWLCVPGVLALVLQVGCAPTGPVPEALPTFLPSVEAAIPAPNEAYPTAQAAELNTSQTVSGFSVELRRAWRDGKQVNAEVCFGLPDSSDWTIWDAHFSYGGENVSDFGASLSSKEDAAGGQPAKRCDALSFFVPPDADLTNATLTIDSIGAYPTSDEYCSLYMPKIQQTLQDRGVAITLDCPEVNGSATMRIASKPESMSEQEAEQLVYSDEFYTVKGPWVFPVTFP